MWQKLSIAIATLATAYSLAAAVARAASGEPTPTPAQTQSPTPRASEGAQPPIVSYWDFADDDSVPVEVRREAGVVDLGGSYVVVRATVNGKLGSFLLDTGAGTFLLSEEFVAGLALQPLGTSSFTGIAGNRIGASVGVVKDFAVGASVLHDVVVDIAPAANVGGRHLDGTIGYPLFAKAIVDVDLAAQRMRVYDPARFEPTIAKNSYVFDIDLAHRHPVISGVIGSGIAIHPMFDTGDSLLLSLSDALRDGNRLVATHAATLHFAGVDGRTEAVDCGRVNRATFGPINYDGPIVCFMKAPIFGKDGGLIGFDFLRHFNWTIDYPDKKFVLTPNGL